MKEHQSRVNMNYEMSKGKYKKGNNFEPYLSFTDLRFIEGLLHKRTLEIQGCSLYNWYDAQKNEIKPLHGKPIG